MKKFIRTSKKTLSVFMAALMVLTAWVFFEPTKAEAIDAGNYYVQVDYEVTDDVSLGHDNYYTGKNSVNTNSNENNMAGFSLFYKTNNGTGTENEIYWSIGRKKASFGVVNSDSRVSGSTPERTMEYKGTGSVHATIPGFPTKFFVVLDNSSGLGAGDLKIYSIKVGSSSNTATTLWSGEIYMSSSNNMYYGTLDSNYNWTNGGAGTFLNVGKNAKLSKTDTKAWTYPYANSVVCSTSPSNITVPDDDKTVSTKAVTYCNDQYGVRLAANPTYSFFSNPTNKNLSVAQSNGTSNSTYTVSATKSALMSGEGNNSTEATITAVYSFGGKEAKDTKTFTVSDPDETLHLDGNGGEATTADVTRKWGDKYGTTPNVKDREGYTLIGFYPTRQGPFFNENEPEGEKLTENTAVTGVDGKSTWYAAWRANKYTATFEYKDRDWQDATIEQTAYYTEKLTAPEVPSGITHGDYIATFTGWLPEVGTMPLGGETYFAQYTQEEVYADYIELEKELALAKEKMDEKLYNEGAYVPALVTAFENAYNNALASDEQKLLLSHQDQVNALTKSLKEARENLKLKTFTVLFVDEEGNILENGYYYVNYGDKVTVPTPAEEPTATHHYVFSKWDSEDSDDFSACDYVTDDLKFIAIFDEVEHTFTENTVPSTCTTDGVIEKTCTECGYSYTEANPNDTAKHSFETKTIQEATCGKIGIEANVCSVCGAIEKDSIKEIPATGEHSFGDWETVTEATCISKGVKKHTCTVCGKLEIETTDEIAHDYETVEVAATCTTDGYTVQRCKVCGNETDKTVTPSTGHTFETKRSEPTCVSIGYEVKYCTVCGYQDSFKPIPATEHKFGDWEVVQEATCTNSKIQQRTCSVCNLTETKVGEKLDHNWGAWTTEIAATCTQKGIESQTCETCLQKQYRDLTQLEHNYETTTTPATCTDAGHKVTKCTLCGDVTEDEVIPALGHSWDEGTVTTEATCETEGTKTFTCKNDATHTKTETIPALGHNWGEWKVTKPSTNDEDGVMTRVCQNNASHTETVAIPKGGHVLDKTETVKAATCTETGEIKYVCSAHDDCNVFVTVETPALGHTWGEWVETTSATCTAAGEETRTCSVCKETETRQTSALGHDWGEWVVVEDSTNDAEGTMRHTCKRDASHTEEIKIPAGGHKLDKVTTVKAATCTATGLDKYSCSVHNDCNISVTVVTPALGHTWGEWVETTPATCTAAGEATKTCSVCGATETKVLSMVAHDWGDWEVVKASTNTEKGLMKRVCKYDTAETHVEYVSTPAGGHEFGKITVTKQPTCETAGIGEYRCTKHADCGVILESVEIPATGHNYAGEVTTAPTCTETGVMTYTCANANCEHPTYTEEIPAKGHSYGEGTVVDPTCETEGYTSYTCDTCGYDKRDNIVPALGHKWSEEVTAPTCETAGYTTVTCANDEKHTYIKDVTNPTGHNYVGAVTTKPTCTVDGEETFTCTNDSNHTYVQSVPATGHKWEETKRVEPTNTKEGYILYTCQNDGCNEEYKVTLAPQGHEFVEDSRVDATCVANGSITYKCKTHTGDNDCGLTYTDTIPALGHEYDGGKVTTPATCTTDGVMTYTCTRCAEGTDGHTKEVVISKTGHNMEGVKTEATCLTDAYWTYTCKNSGCDHTYIIVEKNSKKDHTFTSTTVDPTCETEGLTTYTCSECGYSYTVKIPATGHKWGNWVTVKEATCSTAGTQMRTCLNDSTHKQTKEIPATGEHTYVPTVVKPTCTQLGFTILACTGCGVSIRTDFKPALGHDYDNGVYEEATCETDGGTRYTCQREGCGYSYFVKDKDALGHNMGQWYFTAHPTEKDAFAKKRDCTRDGCTKFEYEKASDGSVNVYYSVEYINDWVTKDENSYFVASDGTKLAKEDANSYKSVSLYTIYVLKGEKAEYPSKLNPSREKTESFGAYDFTGWKLDQSGTSLDAVTKNITAHAQFAGKEVYYKVAFFNANGTQLTNEQVVLHGHGAVYDEVFKNPTMPSNLYYKFSFKYWTRTTNKEGTQNTYDKIYSSGSFTAVYDNIPLEYKVIYHDWNGDVLGSEIFHYSKPVNAPTGLVRQEDASYIYQFTNKWQTAEGYNADINALTVPNTSWKEYDPANEDNEDMTDAEKGILHIYAKYAQTPKLYKVRIAAVDTDGTPIPGATVQVVGSNGQFVTATKLNENSEVVLSLHYDTYYTVQVTYEGNVAQKTFSISDYSFENGNIPTVARLILDKASNIDPDHSDSCSCICHTFLSRIWITLLNIIYRLFGKKTVCCYDMYEKHGDILAYGK